jgi:hypothetical protein
MLPIFDLITMKLTLSETLGFNNLAGDNDFIILLGILLILFLSIYSLISAKKDGAKRIQKYLMVAIIPLLTVFFIIVLFKILYLF